MSNEMEIKQKFFLQMDQMDEQQIVAQIAGNVQSKVAQKLYYSFNGGRVEGLSKIGFDECTSFLAAKKGIVLREEGVEVQKDPEEEGVYLFNAKVTKYQIIEDGTEVKLQTVTGAKRQATYIERGNGSKGGPNKFWYEMGVQKHIAMPKQGLFP